jgi:hypothetical protein
MRIYIIGNDGITLCREPPASVSALRRALGRVESDRNRYAGIDSGKFGAQARR